MDLSFYAKDADGTDGRSSGLDRYDNVAPLTEAQDTRLADKAAGNDFKIGLYQKEAPSTHAADKALLVRLGVNGGVPLARALVNAAARRDEITKYGWPLVAANDNELVAMAA